ncbi:MAG TPA: hypothetical protein VMF13_16690 [Luteitalea sp.]|nr:hypothetical protein [Luteitalea sp.]
MRLAILMLLGLTVLGTARTADVRGWMGRSNTVRNVPRSVRDNPGAYRALYAGNPRYFGGK